MGARAMKTRSKPFALVIGAVLLVVTVVLVAVATSANDPQAVCEKTDSDCVQVAAGAPIQIASLLSKDQASGREGVVALKLAIDYLDGRFDGIDGRLLDHPVSLISADDGCNPAGGRKGATQLLQASNLIATIGTTCSSAALGEADRLMSAAKVLLVSPANSAPLLTDPSRHQRYYFRTSFNDLIQGEVVAEFASSKIAKRRAAIFYTPDSYSRQLSDAFAKQFRRKGGTVVAQINLHSKGGIRAAAAKAARSGPNFIFVPVLEPECHKAVAAAQAEPGPKSASVVVAESCQDPTFLKALGPASRGIYASGPAASEASNRSFYRSEYVPAFVERTGVAPSAVFNTNSFDAANLIFGTILRVADIQPGGKLLINREKLRSALLDITGYQGLSGTLSCTPSGDCAQGARISIYRAPAWPAVRRGAVPVFSQSRTIAELTSGL
jgi:branched-chain amino acid transport system substrate-binding protein